MIRRSRSSTASPGPRTDAARAGANFFRYHGDGAQWNAGLGYTVHNDAGWDTVAVIADDYGFGWTSAAASSLILAAGGEVVTQVFTARYGTD